MRAVIFLTDDFEELEALGTADVLMRGGVNVELVSLTPSFKVRGSHGIVVMADSLLTEPKNTDVLILPGGPGAAAFISNHRLMGIIKRHNDNGKYLAAICAAPVTLAKLGLLKGKTATCYPGMEAELTGAKLGNGLVEKDGNIITAKGPGAAIAFGLAILEALAGTAEMERVKTEMAVFDDQTTRATVYG